MPVIYNENFVDKLRVAFNVPEGTSWSLIVNYVLSTVSVFMRAGNNTCIARKLSVTIDGNPVAPEHKAIESLADALGIRANSRAWSINFTKDEVVEVVESSLVFNATALDEISLPTFTLKENNHAAQ